MKKKIKNQRRKPIQKRSLERYNLIVDALPQVLRRCGNEKTTTEEIALEAEVSIGSVYQYFENKEAIVTAYLERKLTFLGEEIFGEVVEVIPQNIQIGRLVDRVINRVVNVIYEDLDVMYELRQYVPNYLNKSNEKILLQYMNFLAENANGKFGLNNQNEDFLTIIKMISFSGVGLMGGLVFSKPPYEKDFVKKEMSLLINSQIKERIGF